MVTEFVEVWSESFTYLDAKKAKKLHRKKFFSKILEFFILVLYDDVLGASLASR